MTGYGSGHALLVTEEGRETEGRVEVDLRTVNHRFLDVRVRLPPALQEHVAVIEERVGKRLQRGRVEVALRIEGAPESTPILDVERARSALEQLASLRDVIAPGEPVPLALLSTVPDLFRTDPRANGPARACVLEALDAACNDVDAMRLREGRALARDLSSRLERIRAKLAQIRVHVPTIVEAHRDRLRERLEKLLGDRPIALDEPRLEQEVALYADRTDVAEEVARLASHCNQFDEIMQGTGPTHGRKLDFLLQEMSREVNTIGAKVQEPEVTRMVVELKADIERMREQVQNVM